MAEWRLIVADVILLVGLAGLTVAVVGLVRIPDTFVKLHAGSKGGALATGLLVAVPLIASSPEIVVRAVLVATFLLVTSPVSFHALAHFEARRRRDLGP